MVTGDGASTAQRQQSSTATIALLEDAPASHGAALVLIATCCLSWFQRSTALGLAAAHVRGAPGEAATAHSQPAGDAVARLELERAAGLCPPKA